MARPSWHALAWMASAALVAACSAISGLDGDYTLADGTLPIDGSADALADAGSADVIDEHPADSAPPTSCPQNALFCDEFENTSTTPPDFGWGGFENAGGDPSVEAGVGFDGTRGLRATATADGASGSSAKVVLWKTVSMDFADGASVKLSFLFNLRSVGIDYAVLGAIQLDSVEYGIAVYKNQDCPGHALCLDENERTDTHSFTGAVPLELEHWYRADVTVTRSGDAFGGNVVLDGVSTLDDRASNAVTGQASGKVQVGVGTFYTSMHGTNEADADDVVVIRLPP